MSEVDIRHKTSVVLDPHSDEVTWTVIIEISGFPSKEEAEAFDKAIREEWFVEDGIRPKNN